MFIKSVVIDGFKSYGTRTEINGFDSEFNAITGLNGSGKSNILDSVCFVLGISNLSHVRANLLEELIYKNGRAGITKASVTLVFDNADKTKSPINYEQHSEITVTRQIALGGKNRFMINGSTVTSKFIQDFFSSIQLNVNNPHFLIMQGRITKVLNMKPPEILSMIEEAAGTRMYENKKLGAQKTIEKKDSTLKEIDEMVTGQINPKMQRLKEERAQYVEYQRIQRELDQLTRIYIAWDYLNSENIMRQVEKVLDELKNELASLKKTIADSNQNIKSLDKEISEAQIKRDNESGGLLKELEEKLKQAELLDTNVSSSYKNVNDAFGNEQKKLKILQKTVNDDGKALDNKKNELERVQSVFDNLREAEKNDAEALEAAQQKLEAVSSGRLSNKDGENSTFQEQLLKVKGEIGEAEVAIKRYKIEIDHSKKELNSKLPLLKKTATSFAEHTTQLESKETELKSLQDRISKIKYTDGTLENLQGQADNLMQKINSDTETIHEITRRNTYLQFQYNDPEPNFDRSKIHGILGKLFQVKDKRFEKALETAAGGQLYNVVVDNEQTASKLIQKGALLSRTTFAPLNKIRGNQMNPRILQKAERLVGKGNVFCALDLVSYSNIYASLMMWVFGQALICPNSQIAEQVYQDPEIKRKVITFEGVVFDPKGTLYGGAVSKTPPILGIIKRLTTAEQDVLENTRNLNTINSEIRSINQAATSYENIKSKIVLVQQEITMFQGSLKNNEHYRLQQELEKLESAIKEKECKMKELQEEIKSKIPTVKELENNMKNMKSIREREYKQAEMDVKRIKKMAEESRKNWKQRENEFDSLTMEIKELEKTVFNGKEEMRQTEESLGKLEQELKELKEKVAEAKSGVTQMKSEVKAQKDLIGQSNKEIQHMSNKKEQLTKFIAEKELDILTANHEIGKRQEMLTQSSDGLISLRKKYKWIETDKEYFGQPNGLYDFNKTDPEEAGKKVKKLTDKKEKLGKHINTKAMDMLSNQEDRFQNVMDKKTMVEEDRSKILSVIEELDLKKDQVIREAWTKVNHDFNSILNSLLPSAEARLVPEEGGDYVQGLRIRIGFGGIWKESLDELSGGQRSLVALSLILAMLLFKPAPLYILDEVDAALDPSHTQNIGQMLKAHFKQSQFLVVSLKEGMFNNANVLFRTTFLEGMSSVARTTNSNKN